MIANTKTPAIIAVVSIIVDSIPGKRINKTNIHATKVENSKGLRNLSNLFCAFSEDITLHLL